MYLSYFRCCLNQKGDYDSASSQVLASGGTNMIFELGACATLSPSFFFREAHPFDEIESVDLKNERLSLLFFGFLFLFFFTKVGCTADL